MEISLGSFFMMLLNVAIFLLVGTTLQSLDKKRASIFVMLALILSLLPWIKTEKISNNMSHSTQVSSFY